MSYVEHTGEIYAVQKCLTSHEEAPHATSYGPLFVLGTVPPDPVPDIRSVYYATLDRILDGWTDHCGPKKRPDVDTRLHRGRHGGPSTRDFPLSS